MANVAPRTSRRPSGLNDIPKNLIGLLCMSHCDFKLVGGFGGFTLVQIAERPGKQRVELLLEKTVTTAVAGSAGTSIIKQRYLFYQDKPYLPWLILLSRIGIGDPAQKILIRASLLKQEEKRNFLLIISNICKLPG